MKTYICLFLIIVIGNCTNAQGVTKNGKITTGSTDYLNKNGGIGTGNKVDKYGMETAAITILAVGDDYQGGKVAYLFVSGDAGYDANIQHGLIAAISDQTDSWGIRWNNGTAISIITGAAIGTGSSNTTAIITKQGATATSYAAGLARAYTGGGYTDWYLPSIDELSKLWLNKAAIGGFADNYYWSSTEKNGNSSLNAYAIDFYFGVPNPNPSKDNTMYMRAVRTF